MKSYLFACLPACLDCVKTISLSAEAANVHQLLLLGEDGSRIREESEIPKDFFPCKSWNATTALIPDTLLHSQ